MEVEKRGKGDERGREGGQKDRGQEAGGKARQLTGAKDRSLKNEASCVS